MRSGLRVTWSGMRPQVLPSVQNDTCLRQGVRLLKKLPMIAIESRSLGLDRSLANSNRKRMRSGLKITWSAVRPQVLHTVQNDTWLRRVLLPEVFECSKKVSQNIGESQSMIAIESRRVTAWSAPSNRKYMMGLCRVNPVYFKCNPCGIQEN